MKRGAREEGRENGKKKKKEGKVARRRRVESDTWKKLLSRKWKGLQQFLLESTISDDQREK